MRRSPRRDIMTLPYGVWTLACGREVIFSREYRALLMRKPGQMTVHVCNGQKSVPRINTEYFHQGGVVTPELYRRLVRIERDFVAGAPMSESLFWKPEDAYAVKKKPPKIANMTNVVQLFPGAVRKPSDEVT